MAINVPIFLTWMRIAMIPLIVGLYYLPNSWLDVPTRDTIGAIAFIFAALTDWLDGWLARYLKQTTSFGAFLDPVADKLMVCASLLILLKLDRIDSFIVLIIVGREITISALREWMAAIGNRASVAVNWLGKFKTAAQMVAITCLLYFRDLCGLDMAQIGTYLIFIAALITVWSMVYYLRRSWPLIKQM